ncbi:DNA mismatch repair protein MutT [Acrocarpospora corrugata]|uniref:DNA mismatch repair protein MutT n=1 Tax=Acrocarpospora corrugata TaxID=35763 RepID=A0A5M3VP89_9ACTN|nr:NUDIX domain-containing protein [Acrocarpospora corrugata]GER98028.1 DNA mismatch repair protein MutT [Acrocarpospora corrugata]
MTNVAIRHSARVLLVDAAERLLLFRFPAPVSWRIPYFWVTPGGGVDEGESLAVAAIRELREEIGLELEPDRLGPLVAVTSGPAELGERLVEATDSFFFVQVDGHVIDTSGQEEMERGQISAYHWWSLPELAATSELITPLGLPGLLPRLIAGEVLAEPVRLPWRRPPC